MAEYASEYDAICAVGGDVVALSVDARARSEAVRADLRLPFPILSDSARTVVRAWDLHNPKEMGGIAVPAVFVIGPDLRIRYRSIDTTRARVRTDGVLGFLRGDANGDSIARVPVRAGLGDFARAIANVVRRGLRTPHE